ncbi:hypothetical protein BH23GEM10_BH23GEM10_02920 [soil metagenome]
MLYSARGGVIVHLLDGTYELFRHFYGIRRWKKDGDAADGYPGIPGIGAKTAARVINAHGPIEAFPDTVLGEQRDLALLFKDIATLRLEPALFANADELEWRGPTPAFPAWLERIADKRLTARIEKLTAGY